MIRNMLAPVAIFMVASCSDTATPMDHGVDFRIDDAAIDGAPVDGSSGDAGHALASWISIPKGKFIMGAPGSEPCRSSKTEAWRQVELTHGFEIQTTEVTQGQYQSLMGHNPAHFASCGANCPVEQVNWYDAVAYCNALSQKAGTTPCYTCTGSGTNATCDEAAAYSGQKIYSCPGYRLPTEAEWEYAYRAGTKTAYYSGDNTAGLCTSYTQTDPNAAKIGWYCANSNSKTHPVGQKTPNAWGLFDMAGNVSEWCHDWYRDDPQGGTDPWGFQAGEYNHVIRGGSFDNVVYRLRAADRFYIGPTKRSDGVGFRCVRTK